MMKATIYARFSSAQQSEMSIQDQITICTAKINQQGWELVHTFSDAAVSGSTPLILRSGSAALLKEAENRTFDVLVLESLDRLSRDQVEQEQTVRKLEYMNIRIIGVCDGYDSELASRKVLRSVRGLVNELYLDDLRVKTHRGLTGQVTRGYAATGRSYGYDIIKMHEGSIYQINETEAKWVRFIFDEYSKGASVQRIAHRLNHLGIPSPRNSTWAVSAIYGSPRKWSGILNNRLYIGQMVWNRSKWIKDPETGQRKRVNRPETDWLIKHIPELRIISDDLWEAVRKRMDAGRDEFGNKPYTKAAQTLLGGLLRCPYCGGAVVAVNSRSYGCAATKDRGKAVCEGIIMKKSVVEQRLIEYLKHKLVEPESLQAFELEFKKVIDAHLSTTDNTDELNHRLTALNAQIDKLVAALMTIGHSDAILTQLKAVENEKGVVMRHLARQSKQQRYPDIAAIFNEAIDELAILLDSDKQKARAIMQGLFGNIQLVDINGAIIAKLDRDKTLELILSPHINEVVYKRGCEGSQPREETQKKNCDYVFLWHIEEKYDHYYQSFKFNR